jgi:thiamine monophosphate synthase
MYRFRTISNFSHNKIIALGGLSDSNLKLVYLTKAIGIAGISFFKKKGP